MRKICRVKVISCENGKILMITGAMDGCEVCIRLNRTACAFVIICCMCVTLFVCVSSSRPGGVVQMFSNTGEDDESGNLVFREN